MPRFTGLVFVAVFTYLGFAASYVFSNPPKPFDINTYADRLIVAAQAVATSPPGSKQHAESAIQIVDLVNRVQSTEGGQRVAELMGLVTKRNGALAAEIRKVVAQKITLMHQWQQQAKAGVSYAPTPVSGAPAVKFEPTLPSGANVTKVNPLIARLKEMWPDMAPHLDKPQGLNPTAKFKLKDDPSGVEIVPESSNPSNLAVGKKVALPKNGGRWGPRGGGNGSGSGGAAPAAPGGSSAAPAVPAGGSPVGGRVVGVVGGVGAVIGVVGSGFQVVRLGEDVERFAVERGLKNTYGEDVIDRLAGQRMDISDVVGGLEDPGVKERFDKAVRASEAADEQGGSLGDQLLGFVLSVTFPSLDFVDGASDALDGGARVERNGRVGGPAAPKVESDEELISEVDRSGTIEENAREDTGSDGVDSGAVSAEKTAGGGSDAAAGVEGGGGSVSVKDGSGQGVSSGVKSGAKSSSGESFENPGDSDGMDGDDMSVAPGPGDNQNTEIGDSSGGVISSEGEGGCVGAGCDVGMENPFDESGGGGCGSGGGDGCRGLRDLRTQTVFDADLGLTGLIGGLLSLVSNDPGASVFKLVANWDTGGGSEEGPKIDPKGGGLGDALQSLLRGSLDSERRGTSSSRGGVLGLVDLVADWAIDGHSSGPLDGGGGDGPTGRAGLVSNKADGDGYDGHTPNPPKGANTAGGYRTGATHATAGARTLQTHRKTVTTTVRQQTTVQTPTAIVPQTPTAITNTGPVTQTQSPPTKLSSPSNAPNQVQNPTSQLTHSE